MAQEHVYSDSLAKTSVLTNASWLRQYDAYPLDCPPSAITFRIICTIVDKAFPFSLFPSGTQRSPVNLNISKHFGDPVNNNNNGGSTAIASLFKLFVDKTARQFRYPHLIEMADTNLTTETKQDKKSCVLDEGMTETLEQIHKDLVQEWQQDHELKIFMDPVIRIRLMAAVLQDMPRELVKRSADFPALFLTFLIHCDPDMVQQSLRFWPHHPPLHTVSGFWFGLPNMLSEVTCSRTAKPDCKLQLDDQYSLLAGIYVYLCQRLFGHRALVKHLDGLLHSCLGAIFCNNPNQDVREVFVYDKSSSLSAAAVVQGNNVIHTRMREEILYLRALVKGTAASINVDLMQALRIGMTFQELRQTQPDCVKEQKRSWQGKGYRGGLPAAEVRKKLIEYDCASRLAEFDAFVEIHQNDTVICFEIDDTTADAVLAPLQQTGKVHREVFVAQVVDLQVGCRVYLALLQNDYYGYSRWGMYRVRQQYIEDSKTLIPSNKWIPYAYAPTLLQLLTSQIDQAHVRLGMDILRKWAGLKSVQMQEHDQPKIKQILELLQVMLQQYRPEEVVHALPPLLSFRPDPDMLDIAPEVKTAHKHIQHKMSMMRDLKTCARHQDKSEKWRIWHLFIDFLQELVMESQLPWKEIQEGYLAQFTWKEQGMQTTTNGVQDNGYSMLSLGMQAAQVKDTLKPAADCASGLWPLLAVAEQLYSTGTVNTKIPLTPFACRGQQLQHHQCVRHVDAPIAWTKSAHGCKVLYTDSYFPVWSIDMSQNPSLEVNDRFAFIHAKYSGWVTPSMVQYVLATKPPQEELDFRWHTRQDEDVQMLRHKPVTTTSKRKSPEPPTPEMDEKDEEEAPTELPSTKKTKFSLPSNNNSNKPLTLTVTERKTKTLIVGNAVDYNKLAQTFVSGTGYGSMDGMQSDDEGN